MASRAWTCPLSLSGRLWEAKASAWDGGWHQDGDEELRLPDLAALGVADRQGPRGYSKARPSQERTPSGVMRMATPSPRRQRQDAGGYGDVVGTALWKTQLHMPLTGHVPRYWPKSQPYVRARVRCRLPGDRVGRS
jgi:hypothetical protein